MANLITPAELATWTQNDLAAVEADPFALEVMDKVSELAKFLGGHDGNILDSEGDPIPEWDYATAPFDVKMVVLIVCKRTYSNPDQVVQEGSIGPIGGDRVLDAAALLTDLTPSERATLTKYNLAGDPDALDVGLWVQPTVRGLSPDLVDPVLYVNDNQQVNMTPDKSAWPSWLIPMFSPGDPGDPNHYPDE